jgi:hypothetical protein
MLSPTGSAVIVTGVPVVGPMVTGVPFEPVAVGLAASCVVTQPLTGLAAISSAAAQIAVANACRT